MADVVVPRRIASFVRGNIHTRDQLELLLLMVRDSERWWDAVSVAAALTIGSGASRAALEALASRNLLEIAVTIEVRYRFRPGRQALRHAAEECAETYQKNPGVVLRLLKDTPRSAIHDFADAFRIRPDDDG